MFEREAFVHLGQGTVRRRFELNEEAADIRSHPLVRIKPRKY